ncbi:hypothetical protein AGMMS49942_04520 [Spirochaetia bacterium]|nr:hypothetical protein AGMMS49942_04520 [Spirochaetia bacterium]
MSSRLADSFISRSVSAICRSVSFICSLFSIKAAQTFSKVSPSPITSVVTIFSPYPQSYIIEQTKAFPQGAISGLLHLLFPEDGKHIVRVHGGSEASFWAGFLSWHKPYRNGRIAKQAEQLTELGEQLTELREQLTELTEQLTELTEQLTELTEQLTELTEQLTELTEQLVPSPASPPGYPPQKMDPTV